MITACTSNSDNLWAFVGLAVGGVLVTLGFVMGRMS